jgi:hypothetical protein
MLSIENIIFDKFIHLDIMSQKKKQYERRTKIKQ